MNRRTRIATGLIVLVLVPFAVWRLVRDAPAPPPSDPPPVEPPPVEPDVPDRPRAERARSEGARAPAPPAPESDEPEKPAEPAIEGAYVRIVGHAGADAPGIAGAHVVAVRDETTLHETTDDAGVARLPDGFEGRASFWAWADERATVREELDVPSAGEVRIALPAGRGVRVRFVDAHGAALVPDQAGGVAQHVELIWNGALAGDDPGMFFQTLFGSASSWRVRVEVRADAAGLRLARPVGPGMWRLLVGLPSGAPLLSEPFRGDGEGEIVLDLRVPDPASVHRVRVVLGDTDEAVPGARVRAMFEYGDDQAFLPGPELVADEQGELSLPADAAVIGAGGQRQRPSIWWAETDTQAGSIKAHVLRGQAAADSVVRLRVYPTSVVEGEAYTAGGEPAVGAVVLAFEDGRVTRAVVGDRGQYRLEGVYPKRGGRGTTIVLIEDLALTQHLKVESVVLAPGETVRLVIGSPDAANEGGRLVGYLHAGDFPLAGVYVVIDPAGGGGDQKGTFGRTDLEGRITLQGIVPGSYRLKIYFGDPRVSDDHSIRGQEPLEIQPGLEETFDYDLPSGAIRVRVVDGGTGLPIQGAGAAARPSRDLERDRFPMHYYRPGWSSFTNAEGEALMLALVPGEDHQVSVRADGYERRVVAGHVPGTMTEPADVEVRLTKSE